MRKDHIMNTIVIGGGQAGITPWSSPVLIDATFRICQCQRLGQFIGLDQQLSAHSRRLLNIDGLLLSQFPHAGRLHTKPLSAKKNHHKTPHKRSSPIFS